MVTKQAAGKTGELYVFGELLKRQALPFVPLVNEGINALVQTSAGSVIELQVKSAGSAGGKDPRWFQVGPVVPRKGFFIIGVEFSDGEPLAAWILPSVIFDRYASRPPKGSPRDLDLDTGTRKYGLPLRDLLCGFRNRWELITRYEEYEALIGSAEDLEDLLTMKEAQETSTEEALTLEEHEHRRSTTLAD